MMQVRAGWGCSGGLQLPQAVGCCAAVRCMLATHTPSRALLPCMAGLVQAGLCLQCTHTSSCPRLTCASLLAPSLSAASAAHSAEDQALLREHDAVRAVLCVRVHLSFCSPGRRAACSGQCLCCGEPAAAVCAAPMRITHACPCTAWASFLQVRGPDLPVHLPAVWAGRAAAGGLSMHTSIVGSRHSRAAVAQRRAV